MSILVIAEHDNSELKQATLNVVAAARAIGGDIDVLVAGENCGAVGQAAAKADGVSKVMVADNAVYGHFLGENLGELVAEVGKSYSHILAAAGTVGKDFMPRVAALLDVAQVSDIMRVESEDTFVRPIYAGN
ncbi:MAG: electron transfer flavoprotein subunit alpha/FixB family protein, partial [Marinobacter sp.]